MPATTTASACAGIAEIPAMPWTIDRYPPAMSRLPVEVRDKAIQIANALLDQGCDEGRAIRMAIAAAKRWALRAGVHETGMV
jgi:uncharacterized protein YdaT